MVDWEKGKNPTNPLFIIAAYDPGTYDLYLMITICYKRKDGKILINSKESKETIPYGKTG